MILKLDHHTSKLLLVLAKSHEIPSLFVDKGHDAIYNDHLADPRNKVQGQGYYDEHFPDHGVFPPQKQ